MSAGGNGFVGFEDGWMGSRRSRRPTREAQLTEASVCSQTSITAVSTAQPNTNIA